MTTKRIGNTLLLQGDCCAVLRGLPDDSVDAVVTDPPYGLNFMHANWDKVLPDPAVWAELLRVCKPGAHLVCFGGTRTFHRITCAIEDAGWEIRDCLMWLYGSGFPKNLDIRYATAKMYGLCRSSDTAPHVVLSSKPTPLVLPGVRERIALAPAVITPEGGRAIVIRIGVGVGSNDPMDTFWFVWEEGTNWSTGLSWRNTWGALSEPKKSSITEMEIEGITAWRTLFSWAEGRTQDTITQDHKASVGCRAAVSVAEGSSNGSVRRYGLIPTPIAPARVTEAIQLMRREAGRGTSLKPAWEPIILARKPLIGTVAANVLKHGTGGINIDGCRIATEDDLNGGTYSGGKRNPQPGDERSSKGAGRYGEDGRLNPEDFVQPKGRWPANVILDEEAGAALDAQTGPRGAASPVKGTEASAPVEAGGVYSNRSRVPGAFHNDKGGPSRFFYRAGFNATEQLLYRAKAILAAWNPALANTADSTSNQPSEHVASVLGDAATWVAREVKLSSVSMEPSMTATPTESRRLSESVIAVILSIESGCSPEWLHGRLFPNNVSVSLAEDREQTGTTMITTSLLKSDGSVVAATFSTTPMRTDRGGKDFASRFKYCAKASKSEKEAGLTPEPGAKRANTHPTVKPVALMRHLVRLVTPPGGVVLDPFAGSGTTAVACTHEGFRCVVVEKAPKYLSIAAGRVERAWKERHP